MNIIEASDMRSQLIIQEKRKQQPSWLKKFTIFYQRGGSAFANQQMSRVSQVHQDRGERRETEDEKGREGHVETRETEVLWDHKGKVDPWDQKVMLD